MAEGFIKQGREEMCDRKQISVKKAFYFLHIFCIFSVIAGC